MRFTFQSYTLMLLLATLLAVCVLASLTLFVILNQQQQDRQQQILANKSGTQIVAKVFNKLDLLHNQSQQLISAQGNISSQQRQAIIKEFTDIANQGGLATKQGQAANNHMLKEILGNVSAPASELSNRR